MNRIKNIRPGVLVIPVLKSIKNPHVMALKIPQ